MNSILKFLRLLNKKLLKKQAPVNYQIGNKKFHNSLIDSMFPEFITIGDDFTSGPGSIILAHDASLFFHTGYYRVEKTTIGDKVFIGANAVILPGVTIGEGAIIGAGAVVSKDVKPFTVVAGAPAKEICSVQDYFEKHRDKGTLVKAPKSFEKLHRNKMLNATDILKIRESAKNTFNF